MVYIINLNSLFNFRFGTSLKEALGQLNYAVLIRHIMGVIKIFVCNMESPVHSHFTTFTMVRSSRILQELIAFSTSSNTHEMYLGKETVMQILFNFNG